MTTWYSEHYAAQSTASVAPPTSLPDPRTKAGVSVAGVPLKRHSMYMDFGAGTLLAEDDTIRLCTMKSGDRILRIFQTTEASTWTDTNTLSINLGLYEPGMSHDGALIDIDLFVSAVDITGTIARAEALTESTTVPSIHRGKPLWEMLALGDGTDTIDPLVDYDVVATFTGGGTGAATAQGILMIEIEYLPAGRN